MKTYNIILLIILTTDVSVKLRIYTSLLLSLAVTPPNSIALELLIDVKVKQKIGGGLSPVTVGDIHSPKIILLHQYPIACKFSTAHHSHDHQHIIVIA